MTPDLFKPYLVSLGTDGRPLVRLPASGRLGAPGRLGTDGRLGTPERASAPGRDGRLGKPGIWATGEDVT